METDWGMFILLMISCCYLSCIAGYLWYRVDKLEEEIKKLKERHE